MTSDKNTPKSKGDFAAMSAGKTILFIDNEKHEDTPTETIVAVVTLLTQYGIAFEIQRMQTFATAGVRVFPAHPYSAEDSYKPRFKQIHVNIREQQWADGSVIIRPDCYFLLTHDGDEVATSVFQVIQWLSKLIPTTGDWNARQPLSEESIDTEYQLRNAHIWIRSALNLSEDAPRRFDFYAEKIGSLQEKSKDAVEVSLQTIEERARAKFEDKYCNVAPMTNRSSSGAYKDYALQVNWNFYWDGYKAAMAVE